MVTNARNTVFFAAAVSQHRLKCSPFFCVPRRRLITRLPFVWLGGREGKNVSRIVAWNAAKKATIM